MFFKVTFVNKGLVGIQNFPGPQLTFENFYVREWEKLISDALR